MRRSYHMQPLSRGGIPLYNLAVVGASRNGLPLRTKRRCSNELLVPFESMDLLTFIKIPNHCVVPRPGDEVLPVRTECGRPDLPWHVKGPNPLASGGIPDDCRFVSRPGDDQLSVRAEEGRYD